ncbi:MAG: efflux RND transporter periplasmic adaptor subunit [Pirellulaceae bacterium]
MVHEFAHASTCRHYGGEVKEAGIAAILFVPLAYVNVNSSWRFASRWQRLHVTMAGVWAEFGVAALALLVWHLSDQMLIRTMMADVVLMATTSSLLFNLNPWVRFDGYFALMDITGIDNLRDVAKRQTDYLFWRYFLGIAIPQPDDSNSRPHWIVWYGLLSWVYRISVSAGLVAGAAVLFGGAGVTIAIAGAFAFFVQPVWMVLSKLITLVVQRQVNTFVLMLRCGLLVGLSFALTWLIPLHWTWTEPGIVEYDPPVILRATVRGVVDQVLVDSGQFVSKDDHVLTLSNPELELRRFELEKQFGLLQLEVASSRWQQDASELQNAETKLAALAEQIQIVRSQVDQLTVRASVAGRVVARNFQQWAGRYVDEGQELAAIGDERSKRIKLAVSQIRADHAPQWLGKPVAVFANGQHVCDAFAQRIESSASNVASEPRLLAANGGRLATVTNDQDQSTLIESRVNAFVQLSPDQAAKLRCGQRVYVALGGTSESVGSWIWKQTQQAVSAVHVAWSSVR